MKYSHYLHIFWLYICLAFEPSANEVTVAEAWITIGFMFVLMLLAFGADKYNAYKMENEKNDGDK